MSDEDETFYCDTCERSVPHGDVTRTETMGGLDSTKWQTFCCPDCGNRLKTVFVGTE